MTHLRKMMLEELQRRNYAKTTIDCYLRGVEDFSRHDVRNVNSAWGACTPAPLPGSRRSTHFKPLGILKSPHATTACGAPSRSSDLNGQGRPPLQGGEGDPKPLVSSVTENGSGSRGLNVVQSRARNWGAEHMNVQEQIKKYIPRQPEPKRSDMRELHRLTLQVSPECKLWFFDGKDRKNQTVSNPTIGYGFHTIKYADGKSREFFHRHTLLCEIHIQS